MTDCVLCRYHNDISETIAALEEVATKEEADEALMQGLRHSRAADAGAEQKLQRDRWQRDSELAAAHKAAYERLGLEIPVWIANST